MSKLSLKQNPTPRDFQEYAARMVEERGFDKQTRAHKRWQELAEIY